MSRKKQLATNVVVGIIAQLISLALSFVSRTFFLRYLGVEILGLSGTLTSIVQTLSLVELGFYSVVIYRLYKPLTSNNYEECNEILAVLKRFYICVAGVIAVLFACAAPFLRFFLNGVEINSFAYFVYILICANTIVSYFVAYKRSLLYADGKDSIAKSVDCFCNIGFTAARIGIVVLTSNFLLYQTLAIIQTIASNLILHFYCKKKYEWMHKAPINKDILKVLFTDTKNVFAGKLAIYVYGATDNIVISVFLKTVMVGFYSNYIMLEFSLRTLGATVISQIAPFIGKQWAENSDTAVHEKVLQKCSFLCFVMAGIFVVPLYLLADGFITWWLGESFVLPIIIIFLCMDLYIELQQSAFCLYLGAAGLFADDKKIAIIGASCNIISSIILVKLVGLPGVIMGTVISQILYWTLRGSCILGKLFKSKVPYIAKYVFTNMLYIGAMGLSIALLKWILQFIVFESFIVQFILRGITCEICFLIISIVAFCWTEPFKFMTRTILRKRR